MVRCDAQSKCFWPISGVGVESNNNHEWESLLIGLEHKFSATSFPNEDSGPPKDAEAERKSKIHRPEYLVLAYNNAWILLRGFKYQQVANG